MIVPKFWAEARIRQRTLGRQVTVRRFGWSDYSQEDAQAHADARVREAFDRIATGERLLRREPKRPYNGAEGVPIREEILSRHGDAVVTRNLYGAHCLNTPNVLFVDIDFDTGPSVSTVFATAALFWAAADLAIWLPPRPDCATWPVGYTVALFFVLASFAAGLIASQLRRLYAFVRGGAERCARTRVDAFLRKHPDWHLRLYRTPAGLRVLAMQRTFDPAEAAVARCFKALGADPVYARMCLRQRCFRARVSPKPWRIGIGQHIRPRPGVWPVDPAKLPERARWIEAYEKAARSHASCRFVAALGSPHADPAAQAVQALHDALCQADSRLPLA